MNSDWKREDKYGGPIFEELDDELKDSVEHYLEERGINGELVEFVGDYAHAKELKEYANWLEKVQSFVSK